MTHDENLARVKAWRDVHDDARTDAEWQYGARIYFCIKGEGHPGPHLAQYEWEETP